MINALTFDLQWASYDTHTDEIKVKPPSLQETNQLDISKIHREIEISATVQKCNQRRGADLSSGPHITTLSAR